MRNSTLREALRSLLDSDASVNLRELITTDPTYISIIPLFHAFMAEAIPGGHLITREACIAAIEAILATLNDGLDEESQLFFVICMGKEFMATHSPVMP